MKSSVNNKVNNKKIIKRFIFSKWTFLDSQLSDILSVKTGTLFIEILKKIKMISGGKVSKSFIYNIKVVAYELRKIQKSQGNTGLIKFLKSCSIVLQQSCSGYIVSDLSSIGPRISRTKGVRLPRIIPSCHRKIIRNNMLGKYFLIRFYLTIFYMYRFILVRPYTLKLSTITDKGVTFAIDPIRPYIMYFIEQFIEGKWNQSLFKTKSPLDYLSSFVKLFIITKSSPNNYSTPSKFRMWSTHPFVMLKSCLALNSLDNVGIKANMLELAKWYFPLLTDILEIVKDLHLTGPLGKLSFKEEAAGKLRVFAIVDCFTQWLLYPLHKLIFKVLRNIPMDGTFDQLAPLNRLLDLKCAELYSLDLTAATDRLPVDLQKEILSFWIKQIPLFGDLWANLLTKRDYHWHIHEDSDIISNLGDSGRVRYAVGQPMGAYSSWAMLALTHHFIVQYAAWRCGHTNTNDLFSRYALLGDDLVIGDRKVALSYLKIMKELGVGINLSKSILSKKGLGLEFAKRTFINGVDVSPISWKDLSLSLQPGNFTELVAFSNTWKLSWKQQLDLIGMGFRASQKPFKRMNHAMKILYLTNIAKINFRTEALALGGINKAFIELNLTKFKDQVLKENYKLLHRMQSVISDKEALSEFMTRWLLQGEGKIMLENVAKTLSTNKHLASLYENNGPLAWMGIKADPVVGITEALYNMVFEFQRLLIYRDEILNQRLAETRDEQKLLLGLQFDPDDFMLEEVVSWNLESINSFDDALARYFLLMETKADLPSLDALLLKHVAKTVSVRLPTQARLFRAWSRLTYKIVKSDKLQPQVQVKAKVKSNEALELLKMLGLK